MFSSIPNNAHLRRNSQAITKMNNMCNSQQCNQQVTNNLKTSVKKTHGKWYEVLKEKKTYKTQSQQREKINLQNRYTPLTQDENISTNSVEAKESIPKPPPIFVYGVVSLPQMIQKLKNIVEIEQYTTRKHGQQYNQDKLHHSRYIQKASEIYE
jgi:uncharacterized membrane protein